MKYKIWLLALCNLLIISCSPPKEIQLDQLNGYWEIDRVEKEGVILKQYNYNEYIEYFQLKDSVGFRLKLKPSFIGKFSSNLEKVTFLIRENEAHQVLIDYQSKLLKEEAIKELTSTTFALKNEDGLTYFYKKYEPIKLP